MSKHMILYQDQVSMATISWDNRVSDDYNLTLSWLRDTVTATLTPDEAEALGKNLIKAVKKLRKAQQKCSS